MQRIGIFVIALVAGYAVMILGLLGSQEGLFGRIHYASTPVLHLWIAGALSVVCAVCGGAVAARIYRLPCYPPAIAMCVLVVIDTTLLLATEKLDGPLWFDLTSSAALLVGILGGATVVARRLASRDLRFEQGENAKPRDPQSRGVAP